MLLAGQQEGHPACKNRVVECGVVVCLEQGADRLAYVPADATHCLLL